MRRVQFSRYGGPEEMSIGTYAMPRLAPGRLRVRVRAAAINPLDWQLRQGALKLATGWRFPQGMGSDFAGVVEEVGRNVSDFQEGDYVFGTTGIRMQGAFGELVDVAPKLVTLKPKAISFSQAACLPIPAATAWTAILDTARATRDSRILVHGCSGAVGRFAVLLALAQGASVAGACGASSVASVQAMGTSPVFRYDEKAAFAKGGLYDAVFDTLGTLPVSEGLALLKPNGRFIDINPNSRRVLRGLRSRRYRLVFATSGFKHLPDIASAAAEGVLGPITSTEVPFDNALDAITQVEKGQRLPGRVVLTM